jgi:hypothetical protein
MNMIATSTNMAVLKNWSITVDPEDKFKAPEDTALVLQGKIYDDSREKFPNGSDIITSPIKSITEVDTHKEVSTRNTTYLIYPEDVNPAFEEEYPNAYSRIKM